ncbi:DUF4221 family protein [Roseivirga echinicomitans]
MKRNKCKVTLLLVILFVLSNSCESDKEVKYSLELVYQERYNVPLDSLSKRSHPVSYFSDNANEFYVYNELIHHIYVYNIIDGVLIRRIPLSKEGPNQIRTVKTISAIDSDSIYLFSNDNRLVLINKEGVSLNVSYPLKGDDGDPSLVNEPSLEIYNDTLITVVRPSNTTDKAKYKSVLIYTFSDSTSNFYVPFPDSYEDGRWGMKIADSYFAMNHAKNEIVLSHSYSPEIQVFELNSGVEKSFDASSNLMEKPEQLDKGANPYNSGIYMMTNSWYGKILYDKYRKVYYRLGIIGYDSETVLTNPRSKNKDGYDFVTIILNEDFEKVGEKKGLNLLGYTFVNEDGLYVANYSAEMNNEDLMIFARYDLNSIEHERE